MNIAIDGPAGAGKSTIAKRVAKKLASIYVDTGAMYRAMGLHMLQRGISPENTRAVERECRNVDISIIYRDGSQHVLLNGRDVTGDLRHEEVGRMASCVAKNAEVRAKLVALQRKLAEKTSVVMDGRDIGTVVLPSAELKIFLTASPDVRARRRLLELEEKGEKHESFETIRNDIMKRDEQDRTRTVSPLKKAEDAVLVDTSDMTIEEVTDYICALAGKRG